MKTCSICNKISDNFKPFGIKNRPQAQCPVCGSLERHRIALNYYRQNTNLFDGKMKTVLHIAPESFMSAIISPMKYLFYVTIDTKMVDVTYNMDLTDLKFKDNIFDVILCSHVLEHIEDDKKAMSEMYRVMPSWGWCCIQVPIYEGNTYEDSSIVKPADRLKHFDQEDHVRKYGLDIIGRLESVGFKVKHEIWKEEMFDQDLFICTKETM